MTQVSDPDFQNYLQSICDRYQRWQRLYTPTDAQGKKPLELENRFASPFDFGQTVKSISTKQPEAERKQEETEQLPVLEGISKYAPNHVLLTGKPGSGKSTALARLLLEKAKKASLNFISSGNPVETKIPVLVELRYYDTSLISLIENWFKTHSLLLNPSEIENLLFQKRFLLLIDGLNELPSSEAIRDLKRFRLTYHKTPMIFTTRELDSGGNLGIEKLLEMQPLKEAQSQKFVRAYLAEKGEQLLKQLGKRLREFGQTPLLLWMLCELFSQREEIPSNLGLIFRQFTQGYENHLKEDVPVESDRRQWQYMLQHLAFSMMQGKEPTDFRVAISKQEAKAIIRQFWQGKVADPDSLAIKYLDDLLKYHLIQIGSSEQIEFRHQLLQEYYAAEYLLPKLDSLSHEEVKRDYLNYLKWTEPIALMLALVEQEEQAVRIVQLALEVDLNLAARLAGEVKPEFQETTVGLINEIRVPVSLKIKFFENTRINKDVLSLIKALSGVEEVRWRATAVLGQLRSETALKSLIQALKYKSLYVRRSIVIALEEIGSEKAVPSLIKALNDKDSEVRWRATNALEKIDSRKTFPLLIQALQDKDYDVRRRAAEALGQIGSETAVSHLIQALQDKDYDVRRSSAEALGQIGSKTAVPHLIQALNHNFYDVRRRAVEALGQIGSETAVSHLIQALQDKDHDVRRSSAEALGQIGSKTAVPHLIQALNHNFYDVRRRAADALGQIGSKIAVKTLVLTLKDDYSDVRKSAVKALGKIGSEIAVPNIINALNNEKNYYVRRNAASALGEIGSETAIPYLIKTLNDTDSDIRNIAASALGKIYSKTTVPYLIQALQHENYYVRRNAASALGEIGSEIAVPNLINALNDIDSDVRRITVSALGKIGSEIAVPSLIQTLSNDKTDIQKRAASALGIIGAETAIPSLIKAMKNNSSGIRRRVASALGKIGSENATPILVQALNDKTYSVRIRAAVALGEIGSETAVPALIKALKDKDYWVRKKAVVALGKIGSATILERLWKLQLATNEIYISDAIEKIQARCQFYNYEIFNSVSLSSEQDTQNIPTMPENSSSSKYNFPQAQTVQIIESADGDVVAHKYAAQKQNLAEAAQEIQQLLEQLAQTNPTIVESQQEEKILKNIEREIKSNPTIKSRLLSALKAGGTEALTQALEAVFKNPLVSIPVETVKGFIEA
ncbi:MAG: HEAT repeat domain-containing protein [Cyanobacteria bacterium P01_G01_bin.39]